jgi:hypothetical protein
MSFAFGETVTLGRRFLSGRDGDGNDVYARTDITVTGCGFNPGGSTEQVQGQDTVVTVPTLYMPTGTLVLATDTVTVRGQVYEVNGSPNDYSNPLTGWSPGVVVQLRRVD